MKLIRTIIILPFILFVISLTMSNVDKVSLGLYPFAFSFEMPIILVVYISLIFGVITGGFLTWLGGSADRFELSRLKKDLRKANQQIEKYEIASLTNLKSETKSESDQA